MDTYRVYIAGPITGDLAGFIPIFFDAEDRLAAAGHSTFNPARLDGGKNAAEAVDNALSAGRSWLDYMQAGITGLMQCNAIAVLPDWWKSAGANLEQHIAATLGYAGVHYQTGKVLHPMSRRAESIVV